MSEGKGCQVPFSFACNPQEAQHRQDKIDNQAKKAQNQQQQGQAAPDLKARATQAKEAAVNYAMAGAKFKATLALATTAETPVGAAATAYSALSTAGSFTAAMVQSVGVITGETQGAEEGAEAVGAVTSGSGFVTLIGTGSMDKAATAAAIEGILTSSPKDLASGGTLERAAKAFDFAQNVKILGRAVVNAVSGISDRMMNALSD